MQTGRVAGYRRVPDPPARMIAFILGPFYGKLKVEVANCKEKYIIDKDD